MTDSKHAIISRELQDELNRRVRGEVRFDAGSRALYSTDSSNYRQVPLGIVIPRDVDDVVAAVAACREYDVPLVARGAGTSLAGQTCNVAVVLDLSKYVNRVLEIDAERQVARVEPGVILDGLRLAAEKSHLTFGPDPASHNRCTLGGMIGNNSCGVHSIMAGKTDDNVLGMEVLTYDGLRLQVGPTSEDEYERILAAGGRVADIYGGLRSIADRYGDEIRHRFPPIPRRVSGFALEHLLPENGFDVARALVGTEGTCVTVLEATLNLVHSPHARTLVVLGYPDIYSAAERVPEIMQHGPIGLEGVDELVVNAMRKKNLHGDDLALLPEGQGWLLVEFGTDSREQTAERVNRFVEEFARGANPPAIRVFDNARQAQQVWAVREGGLGATAFLPGEPPYWAGWEDSAAPPDRLADYMRDLRKLMERYEYAGAFYGHFGHGCLHTRINFDLQTPGGISAFRSFMSDAADLVVRYGGSLSGEHGDGQARAELLPRMYGEDLVRAFGEFKALWDPWNRMNPGKVVDPHPIDENLRLGTDYRPAQLATIFRFPDDDGRFSQAALRCVGVGKCRRLDGGTMCPSFMVTREEQHSTRGRARLLFEMLQGGAIGNRNWRDENVKQALYLCLACKGCKGECPVRVDMATYKAEFMAHYYRHRLRPVAAYGIGLIYWWARLASHAPALANLVTQTRPLGDLFKRLGGIAPQRRVPAFATETFKRWFFRRSAQVAPADPGPRVILWADTFNNHFTPAAARSAVRVLEEAGFQVVVPREPLCCGRPLYDYGFLDQAKALLIQVMRVLEPEIRAGTPIVGLEPSCIAVFRDELVNLFPGNDLAARLSAQSFLLSEFLAQRAPHFDLPALQRQAIVHGHCHHKSVIGMRDEAVVLDRLGLDYHLLDSGCCGMAGGFGFERGEHYEVAIAAGERVLLPAVRKAPPESLIIADGFSCREQIAQGTGRQALHLAQVLEMALEQDVESRPLPETAYAEQPASLSTGQKRTLFAGAAVLAAGIFMTAISRIRRN